MMDKPRTSADSLIVAIVLLILPVLYVVRYLALVTPRPVWSVRAGHYRVYPQVCSVVFWPLEQLDRKVRPNAWAGWHR